MGGQSVLCEVLRFHFRFIFILYIDFHYSVQLFDKIMISIIIIIITPLDPLERRRKSIELSPHFVCILSLLSLSL